MMWQSFKKSYPSLNYIFKVLLKIFNRYFFLKLFYFMFKYYHERVVGVFKILQLGGNK